MLNGPLLHTKLTQDLIYDNDDDAGVVLIIEGRSVSSIVPLTPPSGEIIDQQGETGDQHALPNGLLLHVQLTQDSEYDNNDDAGVVLFIERRSISSIVPSTLLERGLAHKDSEELTP